MLGDEDRFTGAARRSPGTPGAKTGRELVVEAHSTRSRDDNRGRGSEFASAAIVAAAGGTLQVGDVHNQEAEQIESESASDPLNISKILPPGQRGSEERSVELPKIDLVLKTARESASTMQESSGLTSALVGSMREEDPETVDALMGTALFRRESE